MGAPGITGATGVTGITGATGPTGPTGSAFQQQTIEILGVIEPPLLPLGMTNNYNPPSLSTASIVIVDNSGPAALSGLAAQPGGRVVLLTNNGPGDLTLLEENLASLPENRFLFSLSASEEWTLAPFQTTVLFYDTSKARWRVWSIFTEKFPHLTAQKLLNIQGQFLTSGNLTPPAIAGINDNYLPGGPTAIYSVLRQDLSAPATITGLGIVGTGIRIILRNISPAFALTLTHEDIGSLPFERFNLPGAANLIILPLGSREVVYDIDAQRWFVVSA
jgi:hypothetical protein